LAPAYGGNHIEIKECGMNLTTDSVPHTRPGRALIGWLPADQACLFLAGRQVADATRPEHLSRAEAARAGVAARPAGVEQSGTMEPAPVDLDAHITALRSGAANMFAEGWTVGIADLRRLIAVQPAIAVDHADDRVCDIDPTDTVSIAAMTLPLPSQTKLPANFDPIKQAWTLQTANPNLRIVGQFAAEVQPGVTAFGFAVSVLPSFMQVAHHRGRYLLRDGYHRAVGLLRRGITCAPVFVREFADLDDLGLPAGMLAQACYLGDRPPFIPDYLDDLLAAEVSLLAQNRLVLIHGLEFGSAA
jgi:hypothetical protein